MISPGQQIGRYKIRSVIGKGGMGEVFLATDTQLERSVALKVLPAECCSDVERVKRFRQEAKSASFLNHPNIITIYEVDETGDQLFIATEYVDGETLREKIEKNELSVYECVRIAEQIAAALSAAHQAHIIHRDIKPENIMIRQDGYVKILDFGLAKLLEEYSETNDAEAETIAQVNTKAGMVLGTVAYMSPEQARGKGVDQRTDVWSLGVCLYEMLSGRQPFTGETTTDITASILTKEPEPLNKNLPAELQRIVRKTLQKEADKRYQVAKDLLTDLENVKEELKFQSKLERSNPPSRKDPKTQILNAATTDVFHTTSSAEYLVSEIKQHKTGLAVSLILLLLTSIGLGYWFLTSRNSSPKGQIESIAVMPFVNEGGNAETEYLSDGITESLINSLSQLPKLAVKARSSVFRFKGKTAEPQQIGNELSVQAILNGRIVQRGENITFSLELVDVVNGNQIWGEQYTRKLTDLATLQSEIARDVSNKLQAKLSSTDEKRASKNYTENNEAYQLYLKGRYHWNKRTPTDLLKSAEYFQQAIEKDPNYALAYAALAEAYILIPNYTNELPQNAYPKAREAAAKALQLDESLAEGHNALATIKHSYDWDFDGADKEFKRAIELNPNYATAHHWYGEFLLDMGRIEEGTAEIRRAQELDPLSLIINSMIGITYMIKGQDDLAIEQYKKTLEMDSNFPRAHAFLAKSYENKKLFEEAITAHQTYSLLVQMPPAAVEKEIAEWRESFRINGEKGYWRKYIEILEQRSAQAGSSSTPLTIIATLYIQIGEKEKAFSLLEEAYQKREVELLQIKKDPAWKSMLSDPKFIELQKRIGIP